MTKTVFRRERENKESFTLREEEKEEKVGKVQAVSLNGQEAARVCMNTPYNNQKPTSQSLSSRPCDSDISLRDRYSYTNYILKSKSPMKI